MAVKAVLNFKIQHDSSLSLIAFYHFTKFGLSTITKCILGIFYIYVVMSIRDFMSKAPVTVAMDDRIEIVLDIFEHNDFHHVLVVSSGKLVGVISDRDLLRHLSPFARSDVSTTRDEATLNKRCHQIMSRNPVCLLPDEPLSNAVNHFHDDRISCLPVVNEDNEPLGIITVHDVIRLTKQKMARRQNT